MLNAATAGTARPLLGVGAALFGYLMLAIGFVCIGVASQTADIVWGLWLTEALAIALPALVLIRTAGQPLAAYLGLRWPGFKWLAIAAVTAVLNQPVVSLLTWLAQELLPRSMVLAFEAKNAGLDQFFAAHPVSMIVAVALSAPLGEEIFFRGFALRASASTFKPIWAALLTAALFSLMHADAVGALGLFEIGLWLAVLRWGSGSLWPAMLGHAINNAVAGFWFMLGLQSTGREPPAWAIQLGIDNPDAPPPHWVLAAGAALALLGCWLAVRMLSRPLPGSYEPVRSPETQPGELRPARAWPLWAVWLLAVLAGAVQLLRTRA